MTRARPPASLAPGLVTERLPAVALWEGGRRHITIREAFAGGFRSLVQGPRSLRTGEAMELYQLLPIIAVGVIVLGGIALTIVRLYRQVDQGKVLIVNT